MPENDASSSNNTREEEDHNRCSDEDELSLTLAPYNDRSRFKVRKPVALHKSSPITYDLSVFSTPDKSDPQCLQNAPSPRPSQTPSPPFLIQPPVNDRKPDTSSPRFETRQFLLFLEEKREIPVLAPPQPVEDQREDSAFSSFYFQEPARSAVPMIPPSLLQENMQHGAPVYVGDHFLQFDIPLQEAVMDRSARLSKMMAICNLLSPPVNHQRTSLQHPAGSSRSDWRDPEADVVGSRRRSKVARRNNKNSPGNGKDAHVPNLFPWGTTKRAKVKSLEDLQSIGATKISGKVQCKRCEKQSTIEYDVIQGFENISAYLGVDGAGLSQRAPSKWMSPSLGRCSACNHENCLKPVISEKKKSINWLFLFLGETLGCCTLEQLKYFCKHNSNHRTGAKDRVLFLTYLALCQQLDPNGNWSSLI